jgi:hypothetical protein
MPQKWKLLAPSCSMNRKGKQQTSRENQKKKTDLTKEHLFAAHDGNEVVGVLRTYCATNS